jgi:hypothetical protein
MEDIPMPSLNESCVPQKRYEVISSGACECDLFGNRVFIHVINMRLTGLPKI